MPIGISGFGNVNEYGLNLLPFPPANIIALLISFIYSGIVVKSFKTIFASDKLGILL